jgi:adenylate cyclase
MKVKTTRRKLILSAVVSALLLLVFGLDLLSFLEHRVQDAAYQKPSATNPEIVVFGIDEEALARFGPFQQWSRKVMAEAINILNSDEENKPAVIAIDVMFTEIGADKEADAVLTAAAEAGGNVILASAATIGQDLALRKVIVSYQKPFPELARHTRYGLINGTADTDGIMRNALVQMTFDGETLYSFPYEIYRAYTGAGQDDYWLDYYETHLAYTGRPGDYYGTEGMGVSFSYIFDDDFEPDFFAGSIILIGPFATGLNDGYYTPMSSDTLMNGVEIHANAVQMFVEGNHKQPLPLWICWAILIVFVAAGMIIAEFMDVRWLLVIFAVLGVGYYFLAAWMYDKGYILFLLYPLAALVVTYIYQLIYGYIINAVEKTRLRATFKKYVDPELVDKLIESGEANSDSVGQRRHIAVMFVDVRGFTPMTEALRDEPETIVQTLNEYLELTSSAVFNNGGSVDKFVGDATMALFNGFVPLDDYVYKAVKAAWDIVKGADKVNKSIKEKYNIDIGFGVGVNCGDAIVGNLGPSFRKDYTAIGDTVNTAARLEANALREQVLISKDVYEAVSDRVTAESIGEIPLKGKIIKLEVFAVTDVR